MSITLLYGCCQVETSARNLAETRRFMLDVLGGGLAEQPLAAEIAQIIPDQGYDVDHIECGEAIFQINQPSPTMSYNGRKSIHQAYLDRVGPSVTNLNFFVDDNAHARELLVSMGAEIHIEGPSSAARSLADYGADNTRPGADDRPFLFMGSRHLIGFDLEIMEPNFLHFDRQSAQYPAYVRPRPETGDGNLRLERLIVAVERLQEIYDNLYRMFTPASLSRTYDIRDGSDGKAFRIGLGGIEIEYCEPRAAGGQIAGHLREFGPGVIAIEFSAKDAGTVLSRAREADFAVDEDFNHLGCEVDGRKDRIRCRETAGFDVVIATRVEPSL